MPLGVWSSYTEAGVLVLHGRVTSLDGKTVLEERDSVTLPKDGDDIRKMAADLGERLALKMVGQGARELVAAARAEQQRQNQGGA